LSLSTHLTALEASGLIRLAQIEPELEYLFRHALQQQAAYETLLKTERKRLHLAVGETLERTYPAQSDELAATLAYHFGLAEAHEKALDCFTRAANRARTIYANDEAVAFYRAAIEQADLLSCADAASPDRWSAPMAQLYERQGDVLEVMGKLDEAKTAYGAALKHAPESDRIARARLQRKIGRVWGVQFRHSEAAGAFELAEQALGAEPNAPVVEWRQEWIQIQLDRMRSLYWQGQWREIARLVEQTQPVLQQYGTPALRFYFYDSLISVDERRNRYVISEDVLGYARAMLAAAQESGELRLIGEGHFQLGFCRLVHDDFDEAEEQLRAAEAILRRTGDVLYLAFVLTYWSILYRRRGQPDAARPYILQAHAATQANKIIPHLAVAEGNLAWLCLREQRLAEARGHGLAAIDLWARSSFAYPFQWAAYLPLIAVAMSNSQIAEAIQYARALLEPTQQRLPDPLDTPLAQAAQFYEQGLLESARLCLGQALAAAEQMRYL